MKKILSILIAMLLFACSTSTNEEKEKAEIINLLEKETKYAANADIPNWSSCWVNTDEASFFITDVNGNQNYYGFSNIEKAFSEAQPFKLNLNRSNYKFSIGEDMAFVCYDQKDNWGGGAERNTKETRTLKKVKGEWKLINTSVVSVSSFDKPETASFHVPASKIPPHPGTGFTNISGLAGMTIGYVEVPGPMDFTPLFTGLPHDMCNSPHWGYVIDGSMRIIFVNGKEETYKAGEVFYLPAPHTGVIDKSVKFVDFSPDKEMSTVMDHIAKNLSAKAKNQ